MDVERAMEKTFIEESTYNNKTKGLKLHRVIHLSTYVYLSTKFTYLSYHSLHLHLYPVYLSNISFTLSYHIYSTFLPSLPIEPFIRSIYKIYNI